MHVPVPPEVQKKRESIGCFFVSHFFDLPVPGLQPYFNSPASVFGEGEPDLVELFQLVFYGLF